MSQRLKSGEGLAFGSLPICPGTRTQWVQICTGSDLLHRTIMCAATERSPNMQLNSPPKYGGGVASLEFRFYPERQPTQRNTHSFPDRFPQISHHFCRYPAGFPPLSCTRWFSRRQVNRSMGICQEADPRNCDSLLIFPLNQGEKGTLQARPNGISSLGAFTSVVWICSCLTCQVKQTFFFLHNLFLGQPL